jgi:hypothetical protein
VVGSVPACADIVLAGSSGQLARHCDRKLGWIGHAVRIGFGSAWVQGVFGLGRVLYHLHYLRGPAWVWVGLDDAKGAAIAQPLGEL